MADLFDPNDTPAAKELASTHTLNSDIHPPLAGSFNFTLSIVSFNIFLSRVSSIWSSHLFVTALQDAGCYIQPSPYREMSHKLAAEGKDFSVNYFGDV